MKRKNKTYKLNITHPEMKSLGFHYDFQAQDYVYEFPVFKYNKKAVAICKLSIDEDTSEVYWAVYDANGNPYHSYYNRDYGESDVIKIIDKNITKELSKLGAKSK